MDIRGLFMGNSLVSVDYPWKLYKALHVFLGLPPAVFSPEMATSFSVQNLER